MHQRRNISGGGNFYYGHQASISAFPNSGYKFDGWDGGAIANPLYRFTTVNLISHLNLTAIFSLIPIAQKLEGIHEIAPDLYDSSWFGSFFKMKEAGHIKWNLMIFQRFKIRKHLVLE